MILLAACARAAAQVSEPPPDAGTVGLPAEAPSEAVAESAETEGPAAYDLFQTDRLTGDWGGVRTLLDDKGIDVSLGLTTIYQQNAHGGERTWNAHRISGSYDLELTFDLGAMGAWKGGTVYVLSEGSWDEGISGAGFVGDWFGANWDAADDRSIDVTELWFEQAFLDDHLRVRFGKLYLSVDFETNTYANDGTAQFLNSALNNAGNVPLPDPGQGIQFVATPCDWFYVGAGLVDAEADRRETGFRTAYHSPAHLFSIYEAGFTPAWETARGLLPGNYRVGLWYDPQPKEMFSSDLGGRRRTIPLKRDDTGFYLNFDQLVFKEVPSDGEDSQGLGLFFRYAYAHDDVNEIEHFWSVGGQYQGLLPGRDADVLGLGVASGLFSDELILTGVDADRETVIELYYNVQALPWLNITPDFQWILNPGGAGGRDAFVAGLRMQMAF